MIAEHEIGVHLAARAESRAVGTGAVGRVERELPRLELRQRQPTLGTRVTLGKQTGPWTAGLADDFYDSVGRLQCGLDGIREPSPVRRPDHEPVHHHGDVMVLALVQLGDIRQIVRLAVDADTDEPLFAHRLEHIPELAFTPAHQRREHFDLGTFRPLEDQVGDL